jgi:hypothetical protein
VRLLPYEAQMITVVVDALRRQKSDSLERQLAALVARMNPRRILPPEVPYSNRCRLSIA